MKINYILTFDKGQQTFGECEIDPVFPTKESAIYYFKGLTSLNKRHLLKVSMCMNTINLNAIPKWFMDSNGKLWSDDLGTVKYNKHWATLANNR